MPIIYSKVTTEPSVEPVILADAKTHLRVDHSDEDGLITILIQAAREIIEQRLGRSLITQTRTIKLDYFPMNSTICLPYGPVDTVNDITYYDEDEVLQTLSDTLYWVDADSDIARVIVKNSWPGTYDMPSAVIIEYDAGYGASGSSVPKPIKQAMLLLIGHLYEHRESVGEIMHDMPMGFDMLLGSYVLEQSVIY